MLVSFCFMSFGFIHTLFMYFIFKTSVSPVFPSLSFLTQSLQLSLSFNSDEHFHESNRYNYVGILLVNLPHSSDSVSILLITVATHGDDVRCRVTTLTTSVKMKMTENPPCPRLCLRCHKLSDTRWFQTVVY